MPIIFFGDPGQLPPVGGSSLWCTRTTSNNPLKPLAQKRVLLYFNIVSVMYLTEVRRQNGAFRELLLRLRNGQNTTEGWRLLNETCSLDAMTPICKGSFLVDDCTYILPTNESCDKINKEKLMRIGSAICLVEAEHDLPATKSKSAEFCRRLQHKLYLSIGARVMLLWNISVLGGLVNGSIGYVIDFVYSPGNGAPLLPSFIIINFPQYKGPSFFREPERTTWVPLFPTLYEFLDHDGTQHYRKQYPIQCS